MHDMGECQKNSELCSQGLGKVGENGTEFTQELTQSSFQALGRPTGGLCHDLLLKCAFLGCGSSFLSQESQSPLAPSDSTVKTALQASSKAAFPPSPRCAVIKAGSQRVASRVQGKNTEQYMCPAAPEKFLVSGSRIKNAFLMQASKDASHWFCKPP
ncbi:hypothetical protein E5288_WYG005668 [Bos mutus]|uniref:Uncharacterized protein n=1 Tax=Bos mutus TaxID=72004 RepID=A0A6B0RX78_9CETA|nr:hypothetical protein [Bos mutus]